MDFSLQKPRSEDENINPNDKSIDIQEFLYSDIYEKGLENRIKENSQKLEKYYLEKKTTKKGGFKHEYKSYYRKGSFQLCKYFQGPRFQWRRREIQHLPPHP